MRKLVLAWTVVALLMPPPLEAAPGPAYLPPRQMIFARSSPTRRPRARKRPDARSRSSFASRAVARLRMSLEFKPRRPAWSPRLPKSSVALIRDTGNDTGERIEESKRVWNRSRPYEDDARVKPSIALPTGSSYPAAIAVSARIYAVVLGELFPEKRSELLARGWLIGWGRVMAGVHYPSDVSASLILGDYFAQRLLASPSFRADLAKAKAECQRVFAPPSARP